MTILPFGLYIERYHQIQCQCAGISGTCKSIQNSTKSQHLFQLMMKMNTMKTADQQILDLKRSAGITSDSHRKQTLEFQEDSI